MSARSSVERAPDSDSGGRRFDSCRAHQPGRLTERADSTRSSGYRQPFFPCGKLMRQVA